MAIKADEKEKADKPGEATLKTLVASMHYDLQIVRESVEIIDKCSNLSQEMLLIEGQKSRRFLKTALQALSERVPKSRKVELPGVGHIAADNSGKPDLVARELLAFFKA